MRRGLPRLSGQTSHFSRLLRTISAKSPFRFPLKRWRLTLCRSSGMLSLKGLIDYVGTASAVWSPSRPRDSSSPLEKRLRWSA